MFSLTNRAKVKKTIKIYAPGCENVENFCKLSYNFQKTTIVTNRIDFQQNWTKLSHVIVGKFSVYSRKISSRGRRFPGNQSNG